MSIVKHTFTYTPRFLGNNRWDTIEMHDIGPAPSPISGLNIVQIELFGCVFGDVEIPISIPSGAYVIFKPEVGIKGLPSDAVLGDVMRRYVYFTVNNINNAAFVFSESGIYPANLQDNIPTPRELKDPVIRKSLLQIDAFFDHFGKITTSTDKNKEYQMW